MGRPAETSFQKFIYQTFYTYLHKPVINNIMLTPDNTVSRFLQELTDRYAVHLPACEEKPMKTYEVELSTTLTETIYVKADDPRQAERAALALIDSGELALEDRMDIDLDTSDFFDAKAFETKDTTIYGEVYNASEVLEGQDD